MWRVVILFRQIEIVLKDSTASVYVTKSVCLHLPSYHYY